MRRLTCDQCKGHDYSDKWIWVLVEQIYELTFCRASCQQAWREEHQRMVAVAS